METVPEWILWLAEAAGLLYLIYVYNGFVALKARANAAWSDIDVQLKRRHNLIPNLVTAVKGYATHEQTTLQQVTEARSLAEKAYGMAALGEAESELSSAIQRLLAVAEAYPDLKANRSFLDLQRQLTETEDLIQNARRYYNAVVRDYNTKVDTFPDLVVARLFRFPLRDYFELETLAERQAPEIKA